MSDICDITGMAVSETLLAEIRAFLKASGMSASGFGKLAVNDRSIVFDMEKGRRVWPETEERLRAAMRCTSREADK